MVTKKIRNTYTYSIHVQYVFVSYLRSIRFLYSCYYYSIVVRRRMYFHLFRFVRIVADGVDDKMNRREEQDQNDSLVVF